MMRMAQDGPASYVEPCAHERLAWGHEREGRRIPSNPCSDLHWSGPSDGAGQLRNEDSGLVWSHMCSSAFGGVAG